MKRGELTRLFSEEVKQAVWIVIASKVLVGVELTLVSSRIFWEIKANIMRFILEFHRNEKLVKVLSCTFIAPILKVDEYP
jgi:hypothetical protein